LLAHWEGTRFATTSSEGYLLQLGIESACHLVQAHVLYSLPLGLEVNLSLSQEIDQRKAVLSRKGRHTLAVGRDLV